MKSSVSVSTYIKGLAVFAAVALLNIVAWYVFFNPKGIMRLYTPMYGFSIVVVILASVIMLGDVFDGWPLRQRQSERLSVPQGALLTMLALGLAWVIIFGFFYRFLGKFGITYFSPFSIIATGETGSEIYSARENTSTAIIYLFTAFIWIALTWKLGFRNWPWTDDKAGVVGFSRFFAISFFSIISYAVLFHPHVGFLFYPPQKLAAVSPWWEALADTNSAYVHLGWIVCAIAVVILSETLWEGYPWKALSSKKDDGSLSSGLVAFAGTVLIGFLLFLAMVKGMESYWGKPFTGGQYTDAPYFRYLHAGEMAGFIIMGALVVNIYLENLFNGSSLFARAAVRSIVAVGLGAAFMAFYYGIGPSVLGQVPGIAQPEDTPLCWTFFMVSFMLIHKNFFGSKPVRI